MATTPKGKKSSTGLVLTFDFDKATPGTLRFKEPVDGNERPAVGTIYITKDALADAGLTDAKAITVTIEAAE